MKLHEKIFLFCVNVYLYVLFFKRVREFRRKVGYYPDIAAPGRYHERMLWRKIFDHNPLFTTFSDKLAAKDYIRSRLPGVSFAEILWTGCDVDTIPALLKKEDTLFKANHGWNCNYFGSLEHLSIKQLEEMAAKWLALEHNRRHHEWGYRGARKFLFLEQRLTSRDGAGAIDITVRCSNGKAIFAAAIMGEKTNNTKQSYFDLDGTRLVKYELHAGDTPLPDDFVLPRSFQLAVDYAKKLSIGIDFARYDFMCVDEQIYPGEITVYPAAGLSPSSNGFTEELLRGWDISCAWFLQVKQSGWKRIYARVVRKHFEGVARLGPEENVLMKKNKMQNTNV